jgi:hypothetical protein
MDPEKALLHNGTSLSGEVRENIISDAIHIPPRAVSSKTCLSFYFCAIVWLNKTIFYMCFLLLYRYLFTYMDMVLLLL